MRVPAPNPDLPKIAMTSLDASALRDDPSGMAFLQKVVTPEGASAMLRLKSFERPIVPAFRQAPAAAVKAARRETAMSGY